MGTEGAGRRMRLTGLHHVTLIVADLRRSTRFYRDVLGLSLVREGRNDDDQDARHFWFGDAAGSAGSLVSLMEYPDLPEGVPGRGSTHHLALGVGSPEEQDAWRQWLASNGVEVSDVFERSGLRSLYFHDPDGHLLEIVTETAAGGGGSGSLWSRGDR